MFICEKQIEMNIIKFMESYQDEESCKLKFKAVRDKAGVTCKKCSGSVHCWLQGKQISKVYDSIV